MKEIPLSQGKVALVDDEDFEKVNQFRWYAHKHRGHWYARRYIQSTGSSEPMHRLVMGLEYGDPLQVDHKNRKETLDNRRENLRVTLDQNSQNRGKSITNTSGFKGVSWYKTRGKNKWGASICVNNKKKFLGLSFTPELAAQKYDAAAIKYHKEFAVTNASLAAAA